MSKLKPDRFDEVMNLEGGWDISALQPNEWKHTEFICKYGNYFLYKAWDNNKEEVCIFKTKINKKKVCSKCGQEIKDE